MAQERKEGQTLIDMDTVFKLLAVRKTPQILALNLAQSVGMHFGSVINKKWVEPALWGEEGLLTEHFKEKERGLDAPPEQILANK